MKLYIDTSDSERVIVGLDDKHFETDSRREKSQRLLPFTIDVLKSEKKNLLDIDEIIVNTGPGSFTGLRVGLSVANAMAWVLGIPVNGKNIRKGELVDITYS